MSGYTVDKYQKNGLNVEIYVDDMADDPTSWAAPDDRQGRVTYALKHNRYNLPWEIGAAAADYSSWHELAEAVTAPDGELPGYNYKFVRWYEHSGVSVFLRDDDNIGGWDAGCAGVVFGQTTQDIEDTFTPYAAYISGDVYGYTVSNPKDGEIIDSCCGFYDFDDCKQTAEGEAKAFVWPHDAAYAASAVIRRS